MGTDELRSAVHQIVADALERRLLPGVVVARGVERLSALLANEPTSAERTRRETAEALRRMAELGNTRDAASIVARQMTADPHQREILAQRFRRARRRVLSQ